MQVVPALIHGSQGGEPSHLIFFFLHSSQADVTLSRLVGGSSRLSVVSSSAGDLCILLVPSGLLYSIAVSGCCARCDLDGHQNQELDPQRGDFDCWISQLPFSLFRGRRDVWQEEKEEVIGEEGGMTRQDKDRCRATTRDQSQQHECYFTTPCTRLKSMPRRGILQTCLGG